MNRDQAGSAGVLEVVVLTPLFVLVAMFVVLVGRTQATRTNVAYAARAAARAAAASSPARAAAAAHTAAAGTLADQKTSCADMEVTASTLALVPGGTAQATVTCRVAVSDLGLLRLPGSITIQASAVETVDTVRGGG